MSKLFFCWEINLSHKIFERCSSNSWKLKYIFSFLVACPTSKLLTIYIFFLLDHRHIFSKLVVILLEPHMSKNVLFTTNFNNLNAESAFWLKVYLRPLKSGKRYAKMRIWGNYWLRKFLDFSRSGVADVSLSVAYGITEQNIIKSKATINYFT